MVVIARGITLYRLIVSVTMGNVFVPIFAITPTFVLVTTYLSRITLVPNNAAWRKMHNDNSDGRQLCTFEQAPQGRSQHRLELDLPKMAPSVCNNLYPPFPCARRRS
jgi:hypothetical protein